MARARRRRASSAQSLVEFALLMPVIFFILFLMIDFARLSYTYAAVSWSAREAARVVSMQPQATSDCAALQMAEQTAQGFSLKADNNSLVNNADPNTTGTPNATKTPPAGQGYVYIWPAVATADPPESNCTGTARGGSSSVQDVAVQVKYTYQPMMPMIAQILPPITLTTISVVHVEY